MALGLPACLLRTKSATRVATPPTSGSQQTDRHSQFIEKKPETGTAPTQRLANLENLAVAANLAVLKGRSAELESTLVDLQGFDSVRERGGGNIELRCRPGRSEHAPSARREGCFNDFPLTAAVALRRRRRGYVTHLPRRLCRQP